MSIAISHNMDNVEAIKQADLQKYMGLDADGLDASGSKFMKVDDTANNGSKICYQYQRGGVILQAAIDVDKQQVKWTVSGSGITDTDTDKRYVAICEGLKLQKTGAGLGKLYCGACTFKTANYDTTA